MLILILIFILLLILFLILIFIFLLLLTAGPPFCADSVLLLFLGLEEKE